MAQLPVVTSSDLIKVLEKLGFAVVRQKGSHVVVQKKLPNGTITTVVPNHREVALGTLRSIMKKTGLTAEELVRLLTLLLSLPIKFW